MCNARLWPRRLPEGWSPRARSPMRAASRRQSERVLSSDVLGRAAARVCAGRMKRASEGLLCRERPGAARLDERFEALDRVVDFDEIHDVAIFELGAPRERLGWLVLVLARRGVIAIDTPAQIRIRTRALRIARCMKAEHFRADRVRHVHRSRIGTEHERRAFEQ